MYVSVLLCSAGFYIKSERTRNPKYAFVDYVTAWNHGLQEEGEKMLVQQNRSYPVTMRMAVTMATKQLAFNNSSLEMVCNGLWYGFYIEQQNVIIINRKMTRKLSALNKINISH